MTRRIPLVTAPALTALAVVAGVATAGPALAAPGCEATYAVTGQWSGGFQGALSVRNTGDPLDGWTVALTFADGQTVVQGWGGTWTTGAQPRATHASWNAALPTGASVQLGFLGSWSGRNGAPVRVTLDGTPCAGVGGTPPVSPTPTAPATPTPTSTPSSTPTPSSTHTPSPTPTPTPSPTTGFPPVTGVPPAAYPGPGVVTGATTVHDPAVVTTPAGGYLVAHTGDGITLKTSTDRTAFREAGRAFPDGTPWASTYTAGSATLWAPDLSYRDGRYWMYYSASTFGSNRSAIFLATSTTGAAGSWTNHGVVVESSSSSAYNAIDPNLLVDPQGRRWLTFGSFWSGIQLVQLDPSTGKRLDGTLRLVAGRGGGAIEAPTLVRRGGYYYLFVSFDACCRGAQSTYRVMVGRSTSPTGPFVDRAGVAMTSGGGTQVLAGHGSVHGPGHQAVLADGDGDTLWYHYYADDGTARLGINLLGWDASGWPYVH